MLGKLDFLVVQDMYHSTETAARPTLLLPAAGWGEKEGTFINSERRIGLIKKVRRAPGQALADFHIFKLVAHYYGCGDMFGNGSRPRRCSRSSSDSPPVSRATSRALRLPDARRRAGDPVALPARATDRRPSAGCSPTAGFTTPTAAPGSSSRTPGRGRAADDDYPFQLLPVAAVPRSGTRRRARPSPTCCASSTRGARTSRSTRPTPRPSDVKPGQGMVVESRRRGKVQGEGVHLADRPRGQSSCRCTTLRPTVLTYADFDPYSRQPSYKEVPPSGSGPSGPATPPANDRATATRKGKGASRSH